MRSKHLLLMLLLALMAPWAANAQTLTVYDEGTTTNRYVPIDGYNVDGTSIKSEYIMPASELTAMNGKEITKMTLYLSTVGNKSWGNATFRVFMKEVEATTISSFTGYADATVVYLGALDCTQSEMEISFTENYIYNGGNLLIGFYIVTSGSYTGSYNDYKPLYTGEEVMGASISGTSATQRNFLPKTTFTYQAPSTCFKPQNLTATLTPGNGTIATLNWERHPNGAEDAWVLQYGTDEEFGTGTYTQVNVTGGTPTKDLTGLTAEQTYYARVKPDCDTEGTKWSDAISFTPTNAYTVTVYDAGDENQVNAYIPMYGNFFDDYTKSECIIPATLLENMQWGSINSITFYAKTVGTSNSTWANTNQKVFVKEVNSTTLSGSFSGMDGATIVFDGLLPMPTTSTDGYTINFSSSYTYRGGNLLIGVYNDDDGSYNNVTWYGTTGLTSGVSAYGTDGSSLAGVTYHAQEFLPKTTFNYTPGTAPSCLPPTELAATEDQPNQSVLSWTANNGETNWNLYYKKASVTTYTEVANITDNPYTLQNLDPATTYNYYVVANCTETSDPSQVFTFTTACGTITTFPWSDKFDTYTGTTSGSTNNLPLCWNYLNNCTYSSYQGYPVVYNSSSSSHSGNNHLRFYTSSSYPATEYAILPAMESLNGKMVTFYARYYSSKTDLIVGVMTNPADATTFTAVETIDDLTYSYKKYTINFDEVTGNYIAFKMIGDDNYSYNIYVDDIEVKQQPDCPTPTGLAVTANSQTPEGATITWTAGEGTAWTVEYKKSTEETWTTVTPNVTAATYTFTGLDFGTTYNTRVSVACSGVTYPTEPVNFTTKEQFPAPTNLETSNLTHNSATLAWTAGYTNQTHWKVEYKKSVDAWTAATTEIVSTPTINLINLVENTTYNVRVYGGIGDEFGTASLLGNFTTKNPCAAPTALVVSNVTDQSVTLNWTPGYQETTWTVKYKPSTVTSWDDEAVVTIEDATKPLVINSLTGGTTYNVQVINCENALTGSFTTAFGVPFTEAFATSSIPTGWNNYLVLLNDDVLNGTTPLSGSGNWYFSDTYVFGQYHARLNIFGENCKSWLLTPNVQIGNGYTLSFDLALTDYGSANGLDVPDGQADDKFVVLVSDDSGATWAILREWNNTGSAYVYNNIATAGEKVYIEMPASYNDKTIRIAFYGESTVSATNEDNNIHIDNVSIDETPSCYPMGTLASGELGSTSANLSWTLVDHDQDAWQISVNDATTYIDATLSNGATYDATTNTVSFTLTSLTAATEYNVKVRANCGDSQGEWSNMVTFTTLEDVCFVPVLNAATNIGQYTADFSWSGSLDVESYSVRYRKAASYNGIVEGFDGTYIPDGWTRYSTLLTDNVLNGTTALNTNNGGWSMVTASSNVFNSNHIKLNIYGASTYYWIVTPSVNLPANSNLNFDLAFTAYDYYGASTSAASGACTDDRFIVLISTDDGDTWSILREWNNSGSEYVFNNIATDGQNVTIPLTSYSGNVKIAFYGESTASGGDNDMHIDNVAIGTPVPAGEWSFKPATETNTQIIDLEANTKYEAQVTSICGSDENWSNTITFTTRPIRTFKTEGNWGTASNWNPSGIPADFEDVNIEAAATIYSYQTFKVGVVNMQANGSITIDEGGQLQANMAVDGVTMKKTVNAYPTTGKAGYYLIGNPLTDDILPHTSTSTTNPTTTTVGLYTTASNFDLYKFAYNDAEGLEWQNYKVEPHFNLDGVNGAGNAYLYANAAQTQLNFTGMVKRNDLDIVRELSYSTEGEYEFNGWNLLGNPFSCNAYVSMPYYKMNAAGDGFTAVENGTPIAPMLGIFVKATAADQSVTFSRTAPATTQTSQLNMNLLSGNQQLDNAIMVFGAEQKLEKMSFREGSSKIYMPVEGKDLAITNAEAQGEMPVSFKAEKNGSYTLSFSNEEVTFSYLHLIDNMTGKDVNLLETPSYSFEAKTTDYASRFKLVFSTGNGVNEESFAFISDGNIILNGEGMLQVVDVMGRIMMQEENATSVSTSGMTPGVYVLRLINGDSVRTQKIVVK